MEESGLFELIKTLSKSEKRYFKKYASLHSGKKDPQTVTLFDALEKPENFIETEFKKENSRQSFYKNLASEKQHLMKVLLQSLNEFHRNKDSRSTIRYHLDTFELLFEKRQYRLCDKHLTKAAHLSRRYENFHFFPELYRAFGKLYQHSGELKKLELKLEELKKELSFLTTRIGNELQLICTEYELFCASRRLGYPRNESSRAQYSAIYNTLNTISLSDQVLKEQLSKLLIDNFYLDTFPDKRPLMKVREEWVKRAENDPLFIEDNSMQYLVCLNNIANSYDELGMKALLEQTLQKIIDHPRKNLDEEVRTFIYYYNLRMVQPITTGHFNECLIHFPEAEEGMKKLGRWLHPEYKLSFRYLFAYGNFGAERFQQALKWTNEIILNYPKETLEEYYNFSRIFILLIYYELGYEGLLTSEFRSATRYFNKKGKLYSLEKIILSFVRTALKPEGISSTKEELDLLKREIEKLKKSPYETQLFSLFNWEAWVESKISRRPFAKTIQQMVINGN